MDPEVLTAQHIATQVAGLAYGENCRPGPRRKASGDQGLTGAVPEECVFVQSTGGFGSVAYKDGGVGLIEKRPGVMIIIRSKNNDYTGGWALAQEVHDAIDKNPPSGYAESTATSSFPSYVRKDEKERHEWSINLTLIESN